MMRKIVFSLSLLISCCGLQAQVNSYSISFSIKNMGIATSGTIGNVEAVIKFNPDSLSKSSIVASAAPSSIQTGISLRDKHLKRRDYFDVDHYPSILLRSINFKRKKRNVYDVQFELTIKDISRTISIPVVVDTKGDMTTYAGTFEINRLDFHLGEPSAVLDETVKINLKATLRNVNVN